MTAKDATEEVIDTSDTEERELLDAQAPGYYQRIWGVALDAEMEVDNENDYTHMPAFARLEPRTPSHKRIMSSSNIDPSPVFSRLQISPGISQHFASTTVTPAATPVGLMSNSDSGAHPSDSATPFTSPVQSVNPRLLQSKSNTASGGTGGEDINLNNQSQDPLAVWGTLSQKVKPVDKENINENSPDLTCTMNLNPVATSSVNPYRIMSPTPPLEFPHSSPSPDPLSFSPQPSSNITESFESRSTSNRSIGCLNANSVQKPESSAIQTAHTNLHADSLLATAVHEVFPTDDVLDVSPIPPLPALQSPLERSAQVRIEFSPIAEGPHRFRTPSPIPLPPTTPAFRRVTLTPLSPLTPAPPSPKPNPPRTPSAPPSSIANHSPPPVHPVLIPPDPNPPKRAYSLRNRSAAQMNPFLHDKIQYKRQLRGVPEAIVKNPTMGRGRRDRERYQSGEEEWSNDEEAAEDGDDEWRRNERRKEKRRRNEAVDQQLREMGIGVPSDQEDDNLQDICTVDKTAGEDVEKRGKKRKRRVKAREFPMETETRPSHPPGNDFPAEPATRPRPRPRPDFQRRPPTPGSSKSAHTPSPPGFAVPMDLDVDFEFGVDYVGPNDPDAEVPDGRRSSPIVVDSLEHGWDAELDRTQHVEEPKGHDLDVEVIENAAGGSSDGNSSEESNAVQMTDKARKQFKAMSRMMPAALVKKLLAEQGKPKKKSKTRRSADSDKEEDDAPLQPGHGRKRIVSPGSKDPKRYEIKGDSESESESENGRDGTMPQDQQIISVGDSDDDRSENTENSMEESEEELHAKDIRTWLVPDEVYDPEPYVSNIPSEPRRRRPDHERDRPRGGDLIDRMLQRTNRVGPRKPKSARRDERQPKVQAAGNSKPRLEIITREARRLGAGGGRQTKLSFPKADKPRASGSAAPNSHSMDQDQEHHIKPRDDPKEKKKLKKHNRKLVQQNLYVFGGDGSHKITSGRKRQILRIDDSDDDFHEALAPEGHNVRARVRQQGDNNQERRKNTKNAIERFRASNAEEEQDAFDMRPNGGQKHNHVTLDFDIPLLPSGLSFGNESYMGKGRLADLKSVLSNDSDAPRPLSVPIFEEEFNPDLLVSQISTLLATACDHLYDASIAPLDDLELPLKLKTSEVAMHTLCQLISFRACRPEDDGIAAAVAVQTDHLTRRINSRLELISADGHILDPRSLKLYWFALELELRLAYALKKAGGDEVMVSTASAERYAVMLLRRLLEYGLERTLQPLRRKGPLDFASPDVRTLELWACFSHLVSFFGQSNNGNATASSFWRIVEAAMEEQSNKPDSSLDKSERLWLTMFSMCTISQFSVHGFTTSTVRLGPNWSMVSKALGCIRLSADKKLDQSKPASTLKKRDKYLALVLGRCLLLDVRYHWPLHDADSVIRDLCAIFRSRNFSNLLGEPSDFPAFIRDRDESLFQVHTDKDTAHGLFLKMIVRATKGILDENGAVRPKDLNKLIRLGIPVGDMPFTKKSPPVGQELSMLFNRYSSIIIAIYVEPNGSTKHFIQRARRYLKFKDADYDSQVASIRAMMNMAIILRHSNQPLDDVVEWALEMMNDLLDNNVAAQNDVETSQAEKDQIVMSIQLLLGSIRMVIENPALNRADPRPAVYPDFALFREEWIVRILSYPSLSDQRMGIELRKYINSFLSARAKVFPPPPIPKPRINQVESQDEYADAGLDLDDPAVLALLDGLEEPPDENFIADQNAGKILEVPTLRPIFSLVYKYLTQEFDPRHPDSYLLEVDQWIECWMGCANVVVRNKSIGKDWDFWSTMLGKACDDIKNQAFRPRLFVRFMLTMLQLDPASYESMEGTLLQAWFASIVSSEITIEHEFTAGLLSVGGLRHIIFQNIPCAPEPNTGLVTCEKSQFKELRRSLVDAAVSNVADSLEEGDRYLTYIATMLKAQRGYLQSITGDEPMHEEYSEYCEFVYNCVRKHERLEQAPSVRAELAQGNF